MGARKTRTAAAAARAGGYTDEPDHAWPRLAERNVQSISFFYSLAAGSVRDIAYGRLCVWCIRSAVGDGRQHVLDSLTQCASTAVTVCFEMLTSNLSAYCFPSGEGSLYDPYRNLKHVHVVG